jgi:golgi-specific brefeldin A-resistance guanine nucleotide exchange factor 1
MLTLAMGKEHDFVNVPVLLHTLSGFPQETLAKTSGLILQGLRVCIEEPGPLRSEIMTSPDFWAILRALAGRPDSAQAVFDILDRGTTGSPSAIMADNYETAIALLSDFASASRLAVAPQPKADPKQRNERQAKQAPNRYGAVA